MDRRQWGYAAVSAALVGASSAPQGPLVALLTAAEPQVRRTHTTIEGDSFLVNDRPTYAGRSWRGKSIEGLLLNARFVQATFDDLNVDTRSRWAYPDTKTWDPRRNTREFLEQMPIWRKAGLLSFTLCLQGGSPEGYSKDQPWENSAFDAQGKLRAEYLARLELILDRADELGMTVILGYFYFGQDQRLEEESAVIRAVTEATEWLVAKGYRNVLVEIANECDNAKYDHAIIQPKRVGELIALAQKIGKPIDLKVGVSHNGGRVPSQELIAASDFVLLHGNGVAEPSRIGAMVEQVRRSPAYRPKPILFNEDDHFDFDQEENNFQVALAHRASWGYFDPGKSNYVDGYQCPPVNWSASTDRKRAFFKLLAEITGS